MYEFTSQFDPAYYIFMGDDKFENELLIAHGFPEDVWFHVDAYSSAHLYVRPPRGQTLEELPAEIVEELCQLTKGNSIEGCKKPAVDVVYTPWSNLRKEKNMDTGMIGFHKPRLVVKVRNVARDRELLKRLEKTRKHVAKTEEQYIAERQARDRADIEQRKQSKKKELEEAARKAAEDKRTYDMKHYVDLKPTKPVSDDEVGDGTMEGCRAAEDDFM